MLTLTRRVGETICLGDDIAVTVYDRLRFHVLVAIVAPAGTKVRSGEADVAPALLPDGGHFYLLTLIDHECFRIDDSLIRVRFSHTQFFSAPKYKRQLKVDIDAPDWLTILREELCLDSSQSVGRRAATLRVADWLHRSNASTSRTLVA